jgi:hypothetical protein
MNDTPENAINHDIPVQETEIDANEDNSFLKRYSTTIFIISGFLILISGIVLITLSILYNNNASNRFWVIQTLKYISISIIQIIAAVLVIKCNTKVNYTRKIVHIAYFIIPQILDIILINFKEDIITESWNIWIILLLLFILTEPIRSRINLIDFMFKAVDRPEDRPYTLFWLFTQTIATLLVVLPFALHFDNIGKKEWVFIPILINGLADGLAEPVGIRFGKHKYQTRSCLSSRSYTRSFEGSLCVFIVSLIIILSFYNFFSLNEYIFNSLVIPISITFTEAFSPHTWDSPFIFLVTCGLLSISYFL